MNFGTQPIPEDEKLSATATTVGRMIRSAVGKMKAVDPNEDEEVEARVRHCLGRGEKLGQFYSRTGLSRSQILAMSKAEISAFVDTVGNREDTVGSSMFETKPLPKRLLIEV